MSVILINADGTHQIIENTQDQNITDGKWLRDMIGCRWFELVRCDHGILAWLDEEGILTGRPVNPAASIALHALGANAGWVRGNVLFTTQKGENNAPLTDRQRDLIIDSIDLLPTRRI